MKLLNININMKKYIFFYFLISFYSFSQEAIQGVITHNNLDREYILYIPNSYDGEESVPLVLNLHGYTSNAGEQMVYSNLIEVADTANFLVVHPMGTINEFNEPYWNSAQLSDVDDIDFLNTLIDYLGNEYNVDLERVYSTGFSNGGYMSYTLACELSDKIAAIASVTGSMNNGQTISCSPERPVPVMQIHGTMDLTVPYFGSITSEPVEDVISFWVNFNDCSSNASFFSLPNINTLDNSFVEHYIYSGGSNNSSVELYKIINGGHTWPGAYIPLAGINTNQDFSASEKIWQFFSKYDINGLVETVNVNEIEKEEKKLINTYDLLGRKTLHNGLIIELYDDGSFTKKFKL